MMLLSRITLTMGWPFTIIYLLLIIATTYIAFVTIPKSMKTTDWVEVGGKVTDSQLTKSQRIKRTGQFISVFSANIDYQYIVDGETYSGSRRKFADRSKDGEKVRQAMLKRFPIDAAVPVYYNPNNPGESVLVKGLDAKFIFSLVIFLVLLAWMTTILYKDG